MENMNNILGMKLFFTHSRNEKLREVKRERERGIFYATIYNRS